MTENPVLAFLLLLVLLFTIESAVGSICNAVVARARVQVRVLPAAPAQGKSPSPQPGELAGETRRSSP